MESSNFDTSSHRSETMASLKEPFDEKRKARQEYCYNQDTMESGGQILWNAVAICEMFKTSWQRGKRHTKEDSENHSKGQ